MDSPINFEHLLRRLQQRFQHPVALAAATSEINDCQRYVCYFIAVIELHPDESPIDAVFKHACARGELWDPALGLCKNG